MLNHPQNHPKHPLPPSATSVLPRQAPSIIRPMRGYNADTMLRLARCTLAEPVALEQFLKSCTRASHGRYETAMPGSFTVGVLVAALVLASIVWLVAMILGRGGCGATVSAGIAGLAWLLSMGVSDLRILRSVRRTREGKCAVCNYQMDAAPPPAAITAIVTCPECGEEVIVGRAPHASTDEATSTAARPPQLESPSA